MGMLSAIRKVKFLIIILTIVESPAQVVKKLAVFIIFIQYINKTIEQRKKKLFCGYSFAGFVMWQPELLRLMESGDSSCGHISFNTTADVFNATCDEKMKQNYNIYYETVIVKLWKIPGNLVFILLINKMGRKILLGMFLLNYKCFVGCFFCQFLEKVDAFYHLHHILKGMF